MQNSYKNNIENVRASHVCFRFRSIHQIQRDFSANESQLRAYHKHKHVNCVRITVTYLHH